MQERREKKGEETMENLLKMRRIDVSILGVSNGPSERRGGEIGNRAMSEVHSGGKQREKVNRMAERTT